MKQQVHHPHDSAPLRGVLRMNRRGFGFVETPDHPEDLYIHRENIGSAMDGDEVEAVVIAHTERGVEGRIVQVLARANTTTVGTLEKSRKIHYVIPDNPRLIHDILIPESDLGQARRRDRVVVEITQWPTKHLNPQGKIVEIIGSSDDPRFDSLAIARRYGLALSFPGNVEAQDRAASRTLPKSDYEQRWNLTDLTVLTIDPADARDFDDALSIEETASGWRLGVHIADVSHYVPEGSAADREAFERGSTVYFSDRAIRMLPENISRNVCSLNEGRNSLAKSLLIDLDPNGHILEWRFGKSVIRSRKRFSYEEVTDLLQDAVSPGDGSDLDRTLKLLDDATRVLFEKRLQRGALELNLPELKVLVDARGRVTELKSVEKQPSHRLVEECMLLANTLTAGLLIEKGIPGIFRSHEKPSPKDQEEFRAILKGIGISLKGRLTPRMFQELVETYEHHPLSPVINLTLLKSLKVAMYSAKNTGHYALALDAYTHFTSPIRRYPDLFIHQMFDQYYFSHSRRKHRDVEAVARHASDRERIADSAEEDYNRLKRLRYFLERLEKRQLKTLSVIITGMKAYGFSILEPETLTEGFIKLSSLRDDYYVYDAASARISGRRRRKQFRLGDRVKVKVVNVDFYKQEIEFAMIS